jgi:hypothetical protein
MEFIITHVLALCVAVFRSHGELTVLNSSVLKKLMCVASCLFIHVITHMTIIQGKLLNGYKLQCIILLISS